MGFPTCSKQKLAIQNSCSTKLACKTTWYSKPIYHPSSLLLLSDTLDLLKVVIVKLQLNPLTPLGNHHISRIPPLAIAALLETPDLSGGPPGIVALDIAEEVSLAVGSALFGVGLDPARLEEVVGDLGGGDPLGLALDVAEEPVGVVAEGVVEAALLGRALHAAGAGLLDLDVGELGGRGLGRGGGRGGELLDFEGHGCEADHLAGHPADALEGEAGLDGGGKGFVLVWGV